MLSLIHPYNNVEAAQRSWPSKGDVSEKSTTIIHDGGNVAAGWGGSWAQDMKTNAKAGAPMTQQNAPTEQNAPAEKMAPASKSDQHKATEKGESDSKQLKSQKMDKGAAPPIRVQPMRPTTQTRSQKA